MRKIKVLIVEDSVFFSGFLNKSLSADPKLEVVAVASNPYEARDKIIEFEPDVMTLDIQLPRMDGINFLKKLMPQYPIPVVVVSSISKNVFEALNAGAVDFVTKPAGSRDELKGFVNELITKVKIASTAKVGKWKSVNSVNKVTTGIISNKIIFIGASTGGTEATFDIIKRFPKDIPATLIVQHMPSVFTNMYAERLNNNCIVEVKEAQDGDLLLQGRVLIAPGEHHMTIEGKKGNYRVRCFKGERVNGHCPSVDVLFNSAAELVGSDAVGIILTGMGHDGAKGLLNMRKKGARTIGQNEESSVVYGMPKVAFEIGAVEYQSSIEGIPHRLFSILNEKK